MRKSCQENRVPDSTCSLLFSQAIFVDISSLSVLLRPTDSQNFAVRKHIVSRTRTGESDASGTRSVPFTVRTIYRWVARFDFGGFKHLYDRNRTGRPREWTADHADWIYKVVVIKTPQLCQFEVTIWTTNRLRIAF